MNYFGIGPLSRVFGNLKGLYSGINGATLTGAIDVIVVEQPDGTFKCSPFHVRFGKLGVLRSKEKVVDIEVNDVPATVRMKLGDSGEAFFVEELDSDSDLDDSNLATSPLPSSPLSSSPQLSDEALGLVISRSKRISSTSPPEPAAIPLPAPAVTTTPASAQPKRRRKRKKTSAAAAAAAAAGQAPGAGAGSKSDSSTEDHGSGPADDGVFQMDDVSDALNSLEIGSDSGVSSTLSHSRSYHRDFYSDTEVDGVITPPNSNYSRPSTPIQSDSEYEINVNKDKNHGQAGGEAGDETKWPWGELPSPAGAADATLNNTKDAVAIDMDTDKETSPAPEAPKESPTQNQIQPNKSMFTGMFSFMKRGQGGGNGATAGSAGAASSSAALNPSTNGIYLDDLNLENMDPEKFAMYFPTTITQPFPIPPSGGGVAASTATSTTAPIPVLRTRPEKYKKTLRLSSEKIKSLGLKAGRNEAVFSVTTAYQGTTVARCHIYLWNHDDRVVISDIDGTITKSDVLGHILPIIGKDWAQSGVAQLFTQIQDNGYKMLYLSARAIGQASITRDYLRSIRQGDVTLPDGPLLLNPTSLMSAFHREVIEKKPEEFKIACLKDVQLLFPSNPFYAGYGNRINDVWAYRAVDISISRIFTINHRGELRHALTNTFQSSYTSLIELVEHIFPTYKDQVQGIDGFGSFEFWREPFPTIAEILITDTLVRTNSVGPMTSEGPDPAVLASLRRYSNP